MRTPAIVKTFKIQGIDETYEDTYTWSIATKKVIKKSENTN